MREVDGKRLVAVALDPGLDATHCFRGERPAAAADTLGLARPVDRCPGRNPVRLGRQAAGRGAAAMRPVLPAAFPPLVLPGLSGPNGRAPVPAVAHAGARAHSMDV